MALNVAEIFARTSGLVAGLRARMRASSTRAPGAPDASQALLFAPRFAATSGACTFARTAGWLILHFAEHEVPQNLLVGCLLVTVNAAPQCAHSLVLAIKVVSALDRARTPQAAGRVERVVLRADD